MKSRRRKRRTTLPAQLRKSEERESLNAASPAGVLQLQAAAGNRATRKLVAQRDLAAGEPDATEQFASDSPSPQDRGYVVETPPPSRVGGKRLPVQLRTEMERTFGARFDTVKIHENEKLADNINSQAFAVGNDIYFGAGRYQPHSGSGRQVVAHELTHVLQQRSGRVLAPETDAPADSLRVNTDATLEAEAHRTGRHVAWRMPVKVKGANRPVRRPVDLTAQAKRAQSESRSAPAE